MVVAPELDGLRQRELPEPIWIVSGTLAFPLNVRVFASGRLFAPSMAIVVCAVFQPLAAKT